MLPYELGGGLYRRMLIPIPRGRVAELPAPHALIDLRLLVAARRDPGGGENSTIVATARLRALLIDRAFTIRQHGAQPILVVTHQQMAFGQSGCRNQGLFGYSAKYLDLSGPDVDEVGRTATTDAFPACHGCSASVK